MAIVAGGLAPTHLFPAHLVQALGGAEAVERMTGVDQLASMRLVDVEPFALAIGPVRPADIRPLIPLQPKPLQGTQNVLLGFRRAARGIRVFDPKYKLAAMTLGEGQAKEGHIRGTDMGIACRRRRNTGSYSHISINRGKFGAAGNVTLTDMGQHLDRTLCVAPMMDCTDRHCRTLFRLLSPNALLYTEMVTTGALIHGDAARFLRHGADEPCALQLGGSDPVALAAAARLGEQAGYQEINLNCGCPSDRVQQGGIGACLMAEPALVGECVAAMREAVDIPVTVKSRIGIDDQDSYEFFAAFIETVARAGCDVFIVHARKAMLKGLSPKENREIPPLRYELVRQARADFPALTFVLNGGLKTVEDSVPLAAEFDGVMLGRAPYSNPWLLVDLESALFGSPAVTREAVLEHYQDYMASQIAAGVPFKAMAKHLLGFFTGIPGARAFRRELSAHMFRDGAGVDVLEHALTASGLSHSYPTADTGT